MNNPTTRKHPRTLNEAFGPYTSPEIHGPRQPWSLKSAAAAVALTVSAFALSSCVAEANAQIMSAGLLAAHIQSEKVEQRTQAGYYIVGVFDAYQDGNHCAPKSVGVEQILPFANAIIVNNPQLHDKPADLVLAHFFSRAWPCQRNGKGVV